MDTQEFEKRMREIAKVKCSEDRHIMADSLLCDVLIQLGYGDGVEVYENIDKCYSIGPAYC